MIKFISAYGKVPLIARIAAGLFLGAILGIFLPGAEYLSVLGNLFVGALKAIAPILVFVLVLASLAKAGQGIGRKFGTVVFLYLVSTLLAAVTGVIVSFVFQVGVPIDSSAYRSAPQGLGEVFATLLNNVVMNPLEAIITANYIGILFWAVVIGLALRFIATMATKSFLGDLSDAVSKSVAWIIGFAPFGVLGLVYSAVSEHGLDIFVRYGAIILVLIGCMLLVALVTNPLIVWLTIGKNPYHLVLRCLKDSGVTAFFTRSSAANIPVNMRLCRRLGLDSEYYSVAIPLGATVNMNGAAVTITVMSLGAAFTRGIDINIFVAFMLCFAATLGACGASGVSGGSLLLIPMACSLLGIDSRSAMQVVGTGFIIGVIQDSFETALNSSGDVLFCAAAEFRQWKKQGRKLPF